MRSHPARPLSWILALVMALAASVPLAGAGYAAQVGAPGPAPTVGHLTVNGLVDPLGVSGDAPTLSWQMDAARRGVAQTAYEVRVASSPAQLGAPDVWDSGKVASRKSVEVSYGGPALTTHTSYVWQVKVWDDQGRASEWSDPARFETGLLKTEDWDGARWIGASDGSDLGPGWKDYTVDVVASDIKGALGIYFRGQDSEHAYMWQLSESQHALRPHVKNGGYSVLSAAPFPEGFDFAAEHDYAITVDGSTITTTVDGTELDQRTDDTFTTPGIVGFRTSGDEQGLVHSVTVTSASGTTLVDTDFPQSDRTFTAGDVTDQGLQVGPGSIESWLAQGEDVPLLRTDFTTSDAKEVVRARVYASAHGLYELALNGQRVGDEELAPGWTDYRKRIQYQTYDVTDQVRAGDNVLGAQVARGWYAGRVAMFGDEVWGSHTALLAELRIDYADGSHQTVVTNPDSWRTTAGPITSADLLDGESYDARRADQLRGWSTPGYDASGWDAVVDRSDDLPLLEPQDDQPVRVTQELTAHRISSPTPGTYLYDLGQNMVGHVRITLTGAEGQTVRIRHGEVLKPDGSLYTANLRSAKATDYYTIDGEGEETWEPTFTFHGFRYVELTGLDDAPADDAVIGVVVGTDGELTNDFHTDNALVNQLDSNIHWGQRGNFVSVPTDTPARDERMGWTGDIDVFSRTATYNMDSQAFLNKWLQDLRDAQNDQGSYPGVAPVIPGRFDGGYGSAGWADAGVHVPWAVWQAYGDTTVIRENFAAMKDYVDYLDADSTNHIRSAGGYLDWLNLDDNTPADVLDTAFVARSTREFAEMAAAIGRDGVAKAYQDRFDAIRTAYQDAFIGADGTVKGDSQTGYILTIVNDLVPQDRADALAARFVQTIKRRDWHLSTGFLGVDGLLPALSAIGRTDIAYRLLLNTDYPSWGYEIANGATTVWERWNSIMPDGSFGDVGMNSFNHYAYGAVGEWMYRTLAGISALEPGYRKVLVAPEPGDGVHHASMTYQTPYGPVVSRWDDSAGFTLHTEIPGNATAEVHVPAPSRWAVTEGGRPVSEVEGVHVVRSDHGSVVLSVGSGSYDFAVDKALGQLGQARDAALSVSAAADDLASSGDLRRPVAQHLDAQLGKLSRRVDEAWAAYVSGDQEGAVTAAHQALSTSADLRRWLAGQRDVGRIGASDASALLDGLQAVERPLAHASGLLVGAVASIVLPGDPALPGDTAQIGVEVDNRGSRDLGQVDTDLTVPEGWTVTPTGSDLGAVRAGDTGIRTYKVTVPEGTEAGTYGLSGEVGYQYKSGRATLPVFADLVVEPAVVVPEVSVDPGSAHPGDQATVTVSLANRSESARTVPVRLDVPDGWEAPQTVSSEVPGGGTASASLPVSVPLSVTAAPVELTASVGGTADERGSAILDVTMAEPPALFEDHVDLGVSDSESRHHLSASQYSGVSPEAGLTRRYTNSAHPGGSFEFDMSVAKGEPFLLRAVETYDGAQTKTYDVEVNGQVVHERRYHHGEAGTVGYQFEVPADLTSAGSVHVTFQDVAADYDPSIADVWALPVRSGLDGGNLAADSDVTAKSSLENAGWGTANLVDGLTESIAGGSKGYTSDPPDATTDATEWVAFDLGRPQAMDMVTLFPRTETSDDTADDDTDGAHFPKDFVFQVSDDGQAWRTVKAVTDAPDPGAEPQTYRFDRVSARHVRLYVSQLGRATAEEGAKGMHRLQLAELAVRLVR